MARKTTMTQRARILQYLMKYGSITPIDAMREFGCMRLATRIFELKQSGWGITTRIETAKNQFGENVHYARYIFNNYSSEGKKNAQ
jgi:hypothetical protein